MVRWVFSWMVITAVFASEGVAAAKEVRSQGAAGAAASRADVKGEAADFRWLSGRDTKSIISACDGYVREKTYTLRESEESLNNLAKEIGDLEGKLEIQGLHKNHADLDNLAELRTRAAELKRHIGAYNNLIASVQRLCRVKQRLVSTATPSAADNREYELAAVSYQEAEKAAQATWGGELVVSGEGLFRGEEVDSKTAEKESKGDTAAEAERRASDAIRFTDAEAKGEDKAKTATGTDISVPLIKGGLPKAKTGPSLPVVMCPDRAVEGQKVNALFPYYSQLMDPAIWSYYQVSDMRHGERVNPLATGVRLEDRLWNVFAFESSIIRQGWQFDLQAQRDWIQANGGRQNQWGHWGDPKPVFLQRNPDLALCLYSFEGIGQAAQWGGGMPTLNSFSLVFEPSEGAPSPIRSTFVQRTYRTGLYVREVGAPEQWQVKAQQELKGIQARVSAAQRAYGIPETALRPSHVYYVRENPTVRTYELGQYVASRTYPRQVYVRGGVSSVTDRTGRFGAGTYGPEAGTPENIDALRKSADQMVNMVGRRLEGDDDRKRSDVVVADGPGDPASAR